MSQAATPEARPKMKCISCDVKLEKLLICECFRCNDIEEVSGMRMRCPFENGCNGELNHYYRESCPLCDYSDDYSGGD
jgi:hypothetical protein